MARRGFILRDSESRLSQSHQLEPWNSHLSHQTCTEGLFTQHTLSASLQKGTASRMNLDNLSSCESYFLLRKTPSELWVSSVVNCVLSVCQGPEFDPPHHIKERKVRNILGWGDSSVTHAPAWQE